VVTFKDVPETTEDLRKILFGERTEYHSPYGTECWPVDQIVEIVWNDMQDGPATLEECKETMEGVHVSDVLTDQMMNQLGFMRMPEVDYHDKSADRWNRYEKAMGEYYAQFHRLIDTKAVEEKRVFTFSYSNNDGDMFAAMEHGDLFDHALNVIKTSHH